MNVEIKNTKCCEDDIDFPCLMKSIHDGLIILAIDEDDDSYKGVALTEGRSLFGIIEDKYRDDWIKAVFKPFKGSITLSND